MHECRDPVQLDAPCAWLRGRVAFSCSSALYTALGSSGRRSQNWLVLRPSQVSLSIAQESACSAHDGEGRAQAVWPCVRGRLDVHASEGPCWR